MLRAVLCDELCLHIVYTIGHENQAEYKGGIGCSEKIIKCSEDRTYKRNGCSIFCHVVRMSEYRMRIFVKI